MCAADQVKDRPQPNVTESLDTNILDFCSIDSQGRRLMSNKTLGEKEQDYLDALRVRDSCFAAPLLLYRQSHGSGTITTTALKTYISQTRMHASWAGGM